MCFLWGTNCVLYPRRRHFSGLVQFRNACYYQLHSHVRSQTQHWCATVVLSHCNDVGGSGGEVPRIPNVRLAYGSSWLVLRTSLHSEWWGSCFRRLGASCVLPVKNVLLVGCSARSADARPCLCVRVVVKPYIPAPVISSLLFREAVYSGNTGPSNFN
jgi:hypothetical protein